MLSAQAEDALATLATSLVGRPEFEEAVRDRWRTRIRGSASTQLDVALPDLERAATDLLAQELPSQTRTSEGVAALGRRFATDSGGLILLWCYASTWRRDTELSPLLALVAAQPGLEERVKTIAADRVVEGPLRDALACVPDGRGCAIALL